MDKLQIRFAMAHGMTYIHTMSVAKVAITLDEDMLRRLDQLVRKHVYPNRSRAIQEAVRDKLEKMGRGRLARECAKLNQKEEQALAEEGMLNDIREWPAY